MSKKLAVIAALCLIVFSLKAQITPYENDTLNYRLVGFAVPASAKAHSYLFEIAQGHIDNHLDFRQSIITSKTVPANRMIEAVPAFGKAYTWRVSYLNEKGKVKGKTPLYHFTTGYVKRVDTNYCRIRVLANEGKYKDLLFFIDNPSVMYDMEGKPLWYLPQMPGIDNENNAVRDLKLTPSGTLTCITEKGIYEIDYQGHILWTGPDSGIVSGEGSEHYHHQFTKLSNGHYMVPGSKDEMVEFTVEDTTLLRNDNTVIRSNGTLYKKTSLGTLIEYDAAGKIVWRWYASDYFMRQPAPVPFHFGRDETNINTQMNAFYFDEQDSVIYISFKFISHILKIKYPSGEVVRDYSNEGKLTDGTTDTLFNYQHNCQLSSDGYLYMFNNSLSRGASNTSCISMFKEPEKANELLIKAWEFPCNIDNRAPRSASVGGSVYMLHDGSVFSCMGTAGRLFIVSRDKKVLWNAVPESPVERERRGLRQYKASVIETSPELERLIFHNADAR